MPPSPDHGQDAQRVQQAVAGDATAFAALVDSHAPRLHRWLIATGSTHHDAEDLAQDAFIRAHRALDRYDPRWAFSTWLYTIAQRLRCDHHAKQRRLLSLQGSAAETLEAAPHTDEMEPAAAPFPAGSLWALARQHLSEADVQVLWLHYAEALDAAAIARILASNALAVRVRLHRARSRLKAVVESHPLSSSLPASAISSEILS
jgi:RNA polymerase sigma-70 factor, ECF subfamily